MVHVYCLVHVVIGVCEVCDMCICLVRGGVGGEWIGLYRAWRNMGTVGMCLCFGCGGAGGVSEWVGGLCQGLER